MFTPEVSKQSNYPNSQI